MVNDSWLMPQGSWLKAKKNWRSLEAALSHEPLTIHNRLINEVFHFTSCVLWVEHYGSQWAGNKSTRKLNIRTLGPRIVDISSQNVDI